MSLFILWLLWSGTYTVDFAALLHLGAEAEPTAEHHPAVNFQILILGLVSCGGVTLLCKRMGIVDDETVPVHLTWRVLKYLPFLGSRILKSNFEVIRRIVRRRPDDRPETVVVEASQHTDLGLATYANSITLTPGTVTLDVTGRTITVHALTRATADGVYRGNMDREVAKIEGIQLEDPS